MLRIGNSQGFTLVEVMVTAAVLAAGAVLIYETYFTLLDTFDYCYNYLNIAPWMDEKIWQAQDSLRILGPEAVIAAEGNESIDSKTCDWSLSYGPVGGNAARVLYTVNLSVFLERGAKRLKLSRDAYALYKYEEDEKK